MVAWHRTRSWSKAQRHQSAPMPEGAVSVVAGVERLETSHGPLFAVIGVFDGVHVGHQYLLRHLVSEARRRGARAAVVTLYSHPHEIPVGGAAPLLGRPSERPPLLRGGCRG